MKKIEAVVNPAMKDKVVSAIKSVGVSGGKSVLNVMSKETIVTVVPDSKVDAVLDAIATVACTGTKGDGKVFVTNVEDALDICTKEKGETAI